MEKQDILERVFTWIETTTQNIGDFAKAEIPPFINEFLTWKFYEAVFDCALGLIPLLLLLVWVSYLFFNIEKVSATFKLAGGFDDGCGFAIVKVVVGIIFSAFITLTSISTFYHRLIPAGKDIIQIKVAPKVYLLEKTTQLIKDLK